MNAETSYPLTRRALDLLGGRGVLVDAVRYLTRIDEYRGLCSTWNLSAKLMSPTDLAGKFDDHVADSLTLAPYLMPEQGSPATLVDIGSGAGFPGLPLRLALPELRAILIERSATKALFLRQVIRQLGLDSVSIEERNYPDVVLPSSALVYTARAVEHPGSVDKMILRHLREGDTYLAQRKLASTAGNRTFRVEKVDDDFGNAGLRRGNLYRVRA